MGGNLCAARPAYLHRSRRQFSGHAIRATIDEALKAKEEGTEPVILFGYSGLGLLDLQAYDDFLNDRLDAS